MPSLPRSAACHPLNHDHSQGTCQCGSPMLSQFHQRMMADISRRQFIGGGCRRYGDVRRITRP
jgi:hypothetical protein